MAGAVDEGSSRNEVRRGLGAAALAHNTRDRRCIYSM